MVREILAFLTAGVLVTEFATTVYAQTGVQAQPDNNLTLSGESLRGLESRSVAKDYSNRFAGTSPNSLRGSNNNAVPGTSPRTSLQLRDGVRVIVGEDSLGTGRTSSTPILLERNGDTDQKVRVQYQLRDDNNRSR